MGTLPSIEEEMDARRRYEAELNEATRRFHERLYKIAQTGTESPTKQDAADSGNIK